MVCAKCNHEIDADSIYCKYCGFKVEQKNANITYLQPAYLESIYAKVIGPSELRPGKGNWLNRERDKVGRWFQLSLRMMDINGRPTKGKGILKIYLLPDDDKINNTQNPEVETLKSKSIFHQTYDIGYENIYDDGTLEFIVKNKDEGLIFAEIDSSDHTTAGTQFYGSRKQLWIVFETENNQSVIKHSEFPWC